MFYDGPHLDPPASLQLQGPVLTQVMEPLQSVSTFRNSISSISSDTLLRIFFTALMKACMSRASRERKEYHPPHSESQGPSVAMVFSGVPSTEGGHTENPVCRLVSCMTPAQHSLSPQIPATHLPGQGTVLAPQHRWVRKDLIPFLNEEGRQAGIETKERDENSEQKKNE